MKCLSELPQGYRRILSLDLQKDKKLALRINIAALAVAAVIQKDFIFGLAKG